MKWSFWLTWIVGNIDTTTKTKQNKNNIYIKYDYYQTLFVFIAAVVQMPGPVHRFLIHVETFSSFHKISK